MLRSVAALAAIAAFAIVAACGDDDSDSGSNPSSTAPDATAFPDEQAYFEAMLTVFENVHAQAETTRTALQEGLASDSEDTRRAAVVAYADAYVAYGASAQEQVGAVPAVESATAQHAALAAAAVDLQHLGEALTDAVASNPPADEAGFNNAYFEIDGSVLEQRFRDACVDLQTLATSKGVEVDYQCTR